VGKLFELEDLGARDFKGIEGPVRRKIRKTLIRSARTVGSGLQVVCGRV